MGHGDAGCAILRAAMLTELSLQQFRAHASTTIPLGRLTVLVGPNGSGKSSVLEAVYLLSRLIDAHPSEVFTGRSDLRWLIRHGATADMKIETQGTSQGTTWGLWTTAPRSGDPNAVRAGEVEPPPSPSMSRRPPPPPRKPPLLKGKRGAAELQGASLLRLDSRRLSEPSFSAEELPRLEEDGYGLATVLSALKLASTERFLALEEAVRRIVPSLRALRFKRTRVELQAPRALTVEGQKVVVQDKEVNIADELILDFDDAPGLPAHAVSEGTLLVIGILAAISGVSAPRVLLLEDLERALHPRAQQDFVATLRVALDLAPEMQIIATTHSPYLVDALRPEEIIVLARSTDGAIAARRLSEHPKAKLLDVLTTGEFWTAEGEDWVNEP